MINYKLFIEYTHQLVYFEIKAIFREIYIARNLGKRAEAFGNSICACGHCGVRIILGK